VKVDHPIEAFTIGYFLFLGFLMFLPTAGRWLGTF
jgi:hypothetical protein